MFHNYHPKPLLILPRFSFLCHAFHTLPLALVLSFPLWVSTEQVLGKGDVNMPLAFPSSFPKQTVPESCAPFAPAPRMLSRSSVFLQWLCWIRTGRPAVACYSWCLFTCSGLLLGSYLSAHAMSIKAACGTSE